MDVRRIDEIAECFHLASRRWHTSNGPWPIICVRGNNRFGIDQFNRKSPFLWTHARTVTQVDDHQLGLVEIPNDMFHIAEMPGVTGEVDDKTIGKAKDVAVVQATIACQTVGFELGFMSRIRDETRREPVAVEGRYDSNADSADHGITTRAQSPSRIPANFLIYDIRHFTADSHRSALVPDKNIGRVRSWPQVNVQCGVVTITIILGGRYSVTQVIAMQAAQNDPIEEPTCRKPLVSWASNCTARIPQNRRTIGILKQQGPVTSAKLSIMSPQWCHHNEPVSGGRNSGHRHGRNNAYCRER